MTLPELAEMQTAGRIDALRASFSEHGIDALIVTELTNIRYLTGFTGSNAVLAIGEERAALITDGRYATQAPEQLDASGAAADIVIATDDRDELRSCIVSGSALGLEAASITWAGQQRYADALPETALVATSGLVESLRVVKDDGELSRMARAAAIADAAFVEVRPLLAEGVTERQVALELNATMQRLGATGPAFETIVAAGPNSAKPHARPSDRPIGRGELVVTDFGAICDGYRSDMTRMSVVGDAADELEDLLDAVRRAQAAGVETVGPGVAIADVDRACRSVLTDAGLGDAFVHGTGHGVGLDIHEAPSVNGRATDTLQPGHVITVEPGAYVPELGGVRIEDMVVVTDDGCRALTTFPKDPVSIG